MRGHNKPDCESATQCRTLAVAGTVTRYFSEQSRVHQAPLIQILFEQKCIFSRQWPTEPTLLEEVMVDMCGAQRWKGIFKTR